MVDPSSILHLSNNRPVALDVVYQDGICKIHSDASSSIMASMLVSSAQCKLGFKLCFQLRVSDPIEPFELSLTLWTKLVNLCLADEPITLALAPDFAPSIESDKCLFFAVACLSVPSGQQ